MRIGSMAKCFLILFLILGIRDAYGAIIVSPSGGAIDGGSALISSSGRAWLEYGALSYGEIGESGMVAAFDDPFSPSIGLEASVERPGMGDGRSGAVLSLGPLSLLLSSDERLLAGFSLDMDGFDAAVLYAHGHPGDGGMQQGHEAKGGYGAIYLGADASWRFLRFIALGSFSPDLGFRGLVSAGAEHGAYSLHAAFGSLLPLYPDSPSEGMGIRGSFGNDRYSWIFAASFGSRPVFSEEYMPRRTYASSVLRLGDWVLEAETSSTLTAAGRRRHSERFSLSYGALECGYDTDEGPFAILDLGHLRLGYEDGGAIVGLTAELGDGGSRVQLTLTSSPSIGISVRAHQ